MSHDHDEHNEHDKHDHSEQGHGHGHGARGESSHPPTAGGHGSHGHSHARAPSGHNTAFATGIALNLGFVIVETVYGILAHSMALVADAGHNLSDVLGLALSWGAASLAKRAPTRRRTYGFRSSTILASLANAVVLLVVTGGIAWESIRRLAQPETVAEKTVIVVALIGVAINGFSAMLFMSGQKGDLNIRSAFLHLAGDAALALGVAIAGGIILFTGWHWLDPVVSIVLSLTILASTWSLLKSSTDLMLHAVPEGIDPDAVREHLASLGGVQQIHDLHIWAMSTTETALTAHLVMASGTSDPHFVSDACRTLSKRFGIGHCTLQVENPGEHDVDCAQAPEDAI